MPTDRRTPIEQFRIRLNDLLLEKFEGHYTLLAKRAGIPVSSMQHYMHTARHLPGGEHLVRIAHALDTTVDFLLSGIHSVRPQDLLSTPVNVVKASGPQAQESDRQLSVPVFRCTCPKTCPLSESVPDVQRATGRMVVPVELVRSNHFHRLVGIQADEGMLASGQVGRAIVDWDNRKVGAQERTYLYFDGKHQMGTLRNDGDTTLLLNPASVFPGSATILGCMVALLSKA
jgi:hypothetical protein